jgi:Mg2+ and Co2+ transporter CorA
MSKRGKRQITALSIIGLVIVALIAAGIWQRTNIEALLTSRGHSESELQAMLTENEDATERIIEKLPGVTIRPITDEEREQMKSGELSESEIIDRILDRPASGSTPGTEPDPGGVAATPDPNAEQLERIQELIAKIVVLREKMTGQLDAIKDSALAEYEAMPSEERTSSAKQKLAMKCLREALSLEKQCDSEMESILKELATLLEETGGDTGIIEETRTAYKNEKSLKKAQFIKEYL